MRKTLILVTALAVLVALAAPAAGKGKPPQEPDPPTPADCETNDAGLLLGSPFVAESGLNKLECLWTPAESTTDTGTVTVEATEGSISGVIVFVRDDSPGDVCVLKQDWVDHVGPAYAASFDLAYGEMTDTFSGYANQTYWTWDADHWCYPQDGDNHMREDANGKPLHLRVDFRAKKGTTVKITLSPPQAAPAP